MEGDAGPSGLSLSRSKRVIKASEAHNLIQSWVNSRSKNDDEEDSSDSDGFFYNSDEDYSPPPQSLIDTRSRFRYSDDDDEDIDYQPSSSKKPRSVLDLDLDVEALSQQIPDEQDVDLETVQASTAARSSATPVPATTTRPTVGKGKGKALLSKGKGKAKSSSNQQGKGKSSSNQGKLPAKKKTKPTMTQEFAENQDFLSADKWTRVIDGEFVETSNNIRFSPPFVGPCDKVGELSTPLDCFNLLVDLPVKTKMLKDINDYGNQKVTTMQMKEHSRFHKWEEITATDLLKFFIITIIMGLNKKPDLDDYWSYSPEMFTPFMHKIMTGEKFLMIYSSMLHSGDPKAEGKDKVEPFIELLLKKFREAFYPWQQLSLDEMIIGFKGRWAFKQYNASKPKKYHIKNFGLCDSATGYVLNVLTYYGKNTSYCSQLNDENCGQAKKVFATLLEGFVKGHTIFADRYYTTKELVVYLLSKKFYFTGTLNTNRVGFPAQIKSTALATNENVSFINQNKSILCVMFRDKKANKPVILVSTNADNTAVEKKGILRPSVVDDYNRHMNGCDRLDQMVNYYGIHNRRAKKWWRKLYLWILEVAQYNAYVLYVLSRPEKVDEKGDTVKQDKISFRHFKKKLMIQLCTAASVEIPTRKSIASPATGKRGQEAHCPTLIERKSGQHLPLYDDNDRNCKHCSKPGKRCRTHFYCSGCAIKTYLHPKSCFYEYHTKK